MAHFTGRSNTGTLRIGLPTDFSGLSPGSHLGLCPRFSCCRDRGPLRCFASGAFASHADDLDIAIGILDPDKNPYLVRSWEERPIWTAAKEGEVHLKTPVPIASHPEGCEYRSRMIAALRSNRAGMAHCLYQSHISACSAPSARGSVYRPSPARPCCRHAGIEARPGISGSCQHPDRSLPTNIPRLSDAGFQLVNSLISHMDEAAQPQCRSLR